MRPAYRWAPPLQLVDEDLRSVPLKVTEKSPGVYHVEYTITSSGKHTVMVRMGAAVIDCVWSGPTDEASFPARSAEVR